MVQSRDSSRSYLSTDAIVLPRDGLQEVKSLSHKFQTVGENAHMRKGAILGQLMEI